MTKNRNERALNLRLTRIEKRVIAPGAKTRYTLVMLRRRANSPNGGKIMVQIGNKIKALRLAKSMTQEQLAQRLSVSPQAVSKWENGDSLR